MNGTAWICAAVMALPGACRSAQDQSPVDAYLAFAQAAQRGELTAAYAALSKPTQALLEEHATRIAEASGGAVKADAASLAFGFSRAETVSDLKIVRDDGAIAVLSLTSEEHPHEVKLAKEESTWKIDLTDQLLHSASSLRP